MPGRQIPTLACPHLYTEHDVYGMEYSLWPVWVNYAVCLSPSFLHLQISETWKAGRCPWSHSQLISSGCLSTFFTYEIQNISATERKINSIPAKTRTPAQVFPASPSCSPSFFAGLCPAPSPSFCCLSSSLHCFFAHLCQAPCPSLSPSFSRYPVSCLVLSRYAPLSCKLPLFSSLVVFRALLFVFSSLQVCPAARRSRTQPTHRTFPAEPTSVAPGMTWQSFQ